MKDEHKGSIFGRRRVCRPYNSGEGEENKEGTALDLSSLAPTNIAPACRCGIVVEEYEDGVNIDSADVQMLK